MSTDQERAFPNLAAYGYTVASPRTHAYNSLRARPEFQPLIQPD